MHKKRIMSLLLALCLCLGLSAPALADGEGASLLIHDGTGLISVFGDQSGQGWSYESATNTLTLSGFQGKYINFSLYDQTPTILLADGSSNSVILDQSILSGPWTSPNGAVASTESGLNITGGGKLVVTGGIFAFGELSIQNGTIDTTGQELRSGGQTCGCRYGISALTLSVTGGSVTASSVGTVDIDGNQPYGAEAISCDTFSMSGGALTAASSAGSQFICQSGSFTGGTLTLDGGADTIVLQNFTLGNGVSASGGARTGDSQALEISSSVSEFDENLTLTVFVGGSSVANYVVLTGPGAQPTPPAPVVTPTQPVNTAVATSYSILVDGQSVDFDAYALKDAQGYDTNYLKLRDVAYVLNGTPAQFNVGWDQAAGVIAITTGVAYTTPNGSEMSTPFSGDQAYAPNTAPVLVDGVQTSLEAITITDDSGSGYTYFKLRDLGSALGFSVDWDQAAGAIVISTGA